MLAQALIPHVIALMKTRASTFRALLPGLEGVIRVG